MKSIESITVCPSRAESKESGKVETIDRVGQKLPWIDRLARLDRFRGLHSVHGRTAAAIFWLAARASTIFFPMMTPIDK